ncbi:hypothetical protein DdX_08166 [Ditylenchus destructor]|uniref:Uncharacterized protein n=1 Tax=Ditylenchus destructor TaxID=166010 RepID=A0AAD4R772_9BILA|nr:hypothetical protein DdX_08166 [Ditylenchus destructor]
MVTNDGHIKLIDFENSLEGLQGENRKEAIKSDMCRLVGILIHVSPEDEKHYHHDEEKQWDDLWKLTDAIQNKNHFKLDQLKEQDFFKKHKIGTHTAEELWHKLSSHNEYHTDFDSPLAHKHLVKKHDHKPRKDPNHKDSDSEHSSSSSASRKSSLKKFEKECGSSGSGFSRKKGSRFRGHLRNKPKAHSAHF